MENAIFGCVRTKPIKNMAGLVAMEKHGRRQDKSCEKRCDKERSRDNLAWSCAASGDALGLVEAFRTRKEATGAKEYGKAPVALHMLLVVSPEWVSEAGDMHDPKNPNNEKLFEQAKAWAEDKFGPGSVIASRMDLDEKGGGVVDVFVVPVHEVKQRGKTKNQISVNKAYEAAFGGGRVYGKMQDSWAKHCQKHLDPRITRGISKEITQKEHVHSEIIAPALEKISAEKAEAARQQKAEKEAFEAQQRADKEAFEAEQETQRAKFEAEQEALDAEKASVAAKNAALVAKEAENAQWVIQQKKRLQRAGKDAIKRGIEQGRRESIEEFRNKSLMAKIASYRVTITDEALAMAKSEGEMRVRDEFAGKVSKLTLDLMQEREKRKALEQKNVKTLNALNDANAKINEFEITVSEIAEHIPRNAFMRLRDAIGRSKMLDDIMQVLGIQKDSRRPESGRGPVP